MKSPVTTEQSYGFMKIASFAMQSGMTQPSAFHLGGKILRGNGVHWWYGYFLDLELITVRTQNASWGWRQKPGDLFSTLSCVVPLKGKAQREEWRLVVGRVRKSEIHMEGGESSVSIEATTSQSIFLWQDLQMVNTNLTLLHCKKSSWFFQEEPN